MKTIYELLHFANKTPKHLLLSIPDTVPDVDKEEVNAYDKGEVTIS